MVCACLQGACCLRGPAARRGRPGAQVCAGPAAGCAAARSPFTLAAAVSRRRSRLPATVLGARRVVAPVCSVCRDVRHRARVCCYASVRCVCCVLCWLRCAATEPTRASQKHVTMQSTSLMHVGSALCVCDAVMVPTDSPAPRGAAVPSVCVWAHAACGLLVRKTWAMQGRFVGRRRRWRRGPLCACRSVSSVCLSSVCLAAVRPAATLSRWLLAWSSDKRMAVRAGCARPPSARCPGSRACLPRTHSNCWHCTLCCGYACVCHPARSAGHAVLPVGISAMKRPSVAVS